VAYLTLLSRDAAISRTVRITVSPLWRARLHHRPPQQLFRLDCGRTPLRAQTHTLPLFRESPRKNSTECLMFYQHGGGC
jgi:hypothetical protein